MMLDYYFLNIFELIVILMLHLNCHLNILKICQISTAMFLGRSFSVSYMYSYSFMCNVRICMCRMQRYFGAAIGKGRQGAKT